MLVSLIDGATKLIPDAASWLPEGISLLAPPATEPSITPQNPSTLTLALIGIATIALYMVLTRRARRLRCAEPAAAEPRLDMAPAAASATAGEHRSRGAA